MPRVWLTGSTRHVCSQLGFGHMELVVLLNVGRQPVHYVSNINKYYIKYRALQEDLEEKAKAKKQK